MATFTEKAKLTAYAIVKIFETGKPFGDYSAVAVLDDGAGISYGISQFTHKSGSLELVLRRFRVLGGVLPEATATVWSVIDTPSAHNIRGLSGNARVKAELKELGKHPLMQRAQREIAFEKYMKPAIEACDGSGFRFPLSLAVIYDSKNHGSYDLIRDRTIVETPGNGSMPADDFEREWIAEYCRQRLAWLKTRRGMLRNTVYRPQTFLDLIAKDNWDLDLPLSVRLGTGRIRVNPTMLKDLAAVPADDPAHESESATSENPQYPPIPPAEITPPPDTPGKPVETTVTRTGDGVTVEASKPNQQDVNVPAEISSPEPQGIFKKLTAGITTLITGTLLWQGLEKIGQITFTHTAIAVVCFVVLISFLAFCFWAWLDAWKQNNKTRLEAEAKTAIDRKDIVWK